MTIKSRKFLKGIRLKSTTESPTLDGEISNKDSKLEAHLGGSLRNLVTEDQTQVLTNKTIDADVNSISNIDIDNLKSGVLVELIDESSTNSQIPSALAVKNAIADLGSGSSEASQVSYNNSNSSLTSINLQDSTDELDQKVQLVNSVVTYHIAETQESHKASSISVITSGNLQTDNVQASLEHLQTSIDSITSNTDLSEHINDTSEAHSASSISLSPVPNLNASNLQSAVEELQTSVSNRALSSDLTTHTGSSIQHGVTSDIVGKDDSQTLTNKTISADTNTLSDIQTSNLKAGVLNTSSSLSGATDEQVPSALAVKNLVDSLNNTLQPTTIYATIDNNQSGEIAISGLLFSTNDRSVIIDYTIYRKTDLAELAESGNLRLHYKPIEMTWSLGSQSYLGDESGVIFSINNSGQVSYISTDLSGTNYEGKATFCISKILQII